MNPFNGDEFALIIVCITIISVIKIIFGFIKYLIEKKEPPQAEETYVDETYVDEIISKEVFYEFGDEEPYFKCLCKRTWSNGNVEFVSYVS
jgi:hypothetical protein